MTNHPIQPEHMDDREGSEPYVWQLAPHISAGKIRPMTKSDVPTVAQIDALSFSQPWPPAAFDIELLNDNARCWVVEIEDQVIAAQVIWRVLDEAHIATIAVHPDFRQRGVGKALLQTGMQAAYTEGARIFYLEVRAGNLAAQKMYANFGYEVVGRRAKYYKNNGEDALLLTLRLPEES
jgi:ribosomal-protein-alanine N-acetyltransferase